MNRYPQSQFSTDPSEWLMGTVRRNPEGLLLLAAGCALLMRSGGSKYPQSSHDRGYEGGSAHASGSSAHSSIGEGVSRVAASTSDYASGIKDSVTNAASTYASSVSDYANQAGSAIAHQSERITSQAQSTFQGGMDRMLRDQPLAIAVLGIAAGAAVAAVFPPTEMENRALGGAREALADAAGRAGENLMEAAGAAGEHLKSAVDEKGLNSDGLKDLARDVAGKFAESVAGKPDEPPTLVPNVPSNHTGAGMGAGSQQAGSQQRASTPGFAGPGKRDAR